MSQLSPRLDALSVTSLRNLLRGIEKESLRVQADGRLSSRAHPPALGSALTHPQITTDFSESQLELVTGVHTSIDACLAELDEVHRFVYSELQDERLWAASMPCWLPDEADIPIGQYGSSNIGRLKTVYRQGLSHRYGRRMQMISGVHYNFSLPDSAWAELHAYSRSTLSAIEFRNKSYFELIRNFRRHSWLLLYLFGASPAVCGSFVANRRHRLEPIGTGSMILPWGTSMRMGPLGYQSDAQSSLAVSYNDLTGYADSLKRALTDPWPAYAAMGIRSGDDYVQLNDTLLQIENEFYGTIRPKRRILPGERPLHALGDRGVEYVEVRCLDLDPYSPIGVSARTSHFVDVFLLHCLLAESPLDTPEFIACNAANQLAVAERGRASGLTLQREDGSWQTLRAWSEELLQACEPIAAALDRATGTTNFGEAIDAARRSIADPSLTPSARVLKDMADQWSNSYPKFTLDQSEQHRQVHLRAGIDDETRTRYRRIAEHSLAEQRDIETNDSIDFESYRLHYLTQDLLGTHSTRR